MDYDAVIIGCGHNGLVAAFYLAMAGLRVLGLERRETVGGACATDELFPGYHFSTCAHSFILFHTTILDDMRLEEHGLKIFQREPEMFQPMHSGKHLLFWNDLDRTVESIARISRGDANAYPRWLKFWDRAGAVFEPFLMGPPPTLGQFISRYEGTADEEMVHKLLTGTTRGLLDEYFESEEMKASMLATFDSGSTDAPGALLYWAVHASISGPLGARGMVGYPRGGMGAVAAALRGAAEAAGAEFRTGSSVDSVVIRDGQARGVRLDDGTEISARAVVSNADPRTTFLKLLSSDDLTPEFARKVRGLHADAGYMKLHCATSELPNWKAVPGEGPLPHHFAQAHMCRSLDILDDAWNSARRGRIPAEFSLALVCPSIYDTAAAPSGHYAISIWVEFAPIRPEGKDWDGFRERTAEQIIDQVSEYAPNFKDSVDDHYLYTPQDIEERVGKMSGSMHHIDMTPDQMLPTVRSRNAPTTALRSAICTYAALGLIPAAASPESRATTRPPQSWPISAN